MIREATIAIHMQINLQFFGYLYEIIIPTQDGLKYYYGKKEYDKRIKNKKYIVENYFGSGIAINSWFLKHTNYNFSSRNCPKEIAEKLGVKRNILGFYLDRESLNKAEKELIAQHLGKPNCLNLAEGGTGGNTGNPHKRTEEEKLKYKEIFSGTKNWTNGIINKRSKTCPGKGWYLGYIKSDKEKAKGILISQKLKGKPKSEQHKLALKKKKASVRKKVRCVELNKSFNSIQEACIFFNGSPQGSVSNISRCCKGLKNTWKNYHWEYVEN